MARPTKSSYNKCMEAFNWQLCTMETCIDPAPILTTRRRLLTTKLDLFSKSNRWNGTDIFAKNAPETGSILAVCYPTMQKYWRVNEDLSISVAVSYVWISWKLTVRFWFIVVSVHGPPNPCISNAADGLIRSQQVAKYVQNEYHIR